MKILTFDTSLDKTYVTFSRDGNILSSEIIENHNEKYHSAFLMPAIVSVLKDNNVNMQDINVIGTNIGPGSFTGIRACVTAARVFAQQLDIPLVGVSSLEILSHLNNSEQDSIVVLDARKNHFYTAVFDKNGTELKQPSLTEKDEMLKMNFSDSFVISDNSSHDILKDSGVDSIVYSEQKAQLGIILNNLVYKKINNANKGAFLWGRLKPLYLQAPPVTLSVKK